MCMYAYTLIKLKQVSVGRILMKPRTSLSVKWETFSLVNGTEIRIGGFVCKHYRNAAVESKESKKKKEEQNWISLYTVKRNSNND